jgi:nicotinic acid mononucleotide adenylyltransferase
MNESVTYERLLRKEIHEAFMRVAEAIADDIGLDELIVADVPFELFSVEREQGDA